jgi:hypothetical protein
MTLKTDVSTMITLKRSVIVKMTLGELARRRADLLGLLK